MSDTENQRGEPSMEEILSSIKRIIADDAPPAKAAKPKVGFSKAAAQAGPADGKILELTEDDAVTQTANRPARDTADSDAATETAEQLLDDSKIANLANRFSTLQTLSEPGAAPQIVRSGETSLEELTRELLRPMLKEWLDTKLPEIVEAMVAREISRITKKN